MSTINGLNRYIEESNGNKNLTLAPTDESKDTLRTHFRAKSEILLDQ